MLSASANPSTVPYDWAAHPIWYNVFHPWHWLTYGNNGTAAATAAVLIYTYLTYQMAHTSQDALRASYRPMLAVSKAEEAYTFKVQNIGTGPAMGVRIKVVHFENPNGPREGSWFKGISAVTPITSIKGIPLGKEASCTFALPEHCQKNQFMIAATCWDMTRVFQQSMSFFPHHPQWEDREMETSLYSRSGMMKAYFSSIHPSDERRMVYYWIPGFQAVVIAMTYAYYFRNKFATWKKNLLSSNTR